MMSVTIDPSESRPAVMHVAASRQPVAPILRMMALGTLGSIGLVGFSVGAYSMLGQLARPQPVKVMISRQAAEWPDLKDGIPAMAPIARDIARPPPQSADARPASEARGVTMAATATASPPPRKAALPPIEAATVIDSVRLAPLAMPPMATLVPPTSAETVRARAAETRVAALPPEPAALQAPKPAMRKAPPASARTKPVPERAADSVAAAAPEPAEAEETEVFGVKVPTLATSGRRLVEGVQSLGNAVAGQF